MKTLFVSSEAHPLIKTGGLADVSGALPKALHRLRNDVRLLLPAYPEVKSRAGKLRTVTTLALPGTPEPVTLLAGRVPGTSVTLYLVDAPAYFERSGNPYTAADGSGWPDNPQRFALFSRAAAAIALDRAGLQWQPEVVHCNDWQSALVPALLSLESDRPRTVFTIHNLAYQGVFGAELFDALQLPAELWSSDGLEFYGLLNFIKGGIAYADAVTTVSPTYAREICHPAFGYGLEGLLRSRAEHLHGILNGVDYGHWNPEDDPHLPAHYSAERLKGKTACKAALQEEMGLAAEPELPLLAHIGRLVEQKGVDLILGAIAALPENAEYQLAILGSGERHLERALLDAAQRHPGRIAIRIGYDEALAHRIEGGADLFLMPSRFEPCGLNQIYSLHYGTVPLVHRVGGLADSVVDAIDHTLAAGIATGFVFDHPDAFDLRMAIQRALTLYRDRKAWRKLMMNGMAQDFSWDNSARQYATLYRSLNHL